MTTVLFDVSVLATGWARPAVGRTGVHRATECLFRVLAKDPRIQLELCSRARTPDALNWARQDLLARSLPFRASPLQRWASRHPAFAKFAALDRAIRPNPSHVRIDALLVPHFHHVGDGARKFPKRLSILHDPLPVTHPEWFASDDAHILRRAAEKWNRDHWTMVFTAEATRTEAVSALGLGNLPSLIAPMGVDHSVFHPPHGLVNQDFRRQIGVQGEWFCTLGTLEPRKNLVTAIEAFKLLLKTSGRQDIWLVLAGNRGWKNEEFDRVFASCDAFIRSRISIPGYIADDALPLLYAGALGFLFPSFAEGFGLPPLEAMACGCPVISSDRSCMPGILGTAPLYASPDSPDDWRRAMEALTNSSELRESKRSEGIRHASNFTWKAMGDRIVEHIQDP